MTLLDLVKSLAAVREAQYPTKKIGAIDFKYSPKSKQLFIDAQAVPLNPEGASGSYALKLVINQVSSSDTQSSSHPLAVYDEYGNVTFISQPKVDVNTVQTKCSCKDFYFMWSYYDKQNKALFGRHKPYVRKTTHLPPRNPTESPGMCKHLLILVKQLMADRVIAPNSTISQYLNRKPRSMW